MNNKKPELRELLENQHSFPGPFTFKFIGKADDDFTARVVAAVRDALKVSEDPPHAIRPSNGGSHVSITLVPVVESPDHVLAVYDQVGRVDGLKISL